MYQTLRLLCHLLGLASAYRKSSWVVTGLATMAYCGSCRWLLAADRELHAFAVTIFQPAVVCREQAAPLLRSLCAGVRDDGELHAALEGLLAATPFVRAAALAALPSAPALTGRQPLFHPDCLAILFIACHDATAANAEAAASIWQRAHCKLQVRR